MPNVTDPYMSINQVNPGAAWTDHPPAVAPPGGGESTVFQIYVPAEKTLIDYGAGQVPGIRMATDRHAHITAQSPRTTLSLGLAGGDGISGPPGFNIMTEGDKREVIHGDTQEIYKKTATIEHEGSLHLYNKDTKSESVNGAWRESCESEKTERVHGAWTVNCDNAKTETVDGTFTQVINSEYNIRAQKDSLSVYGGSFQQDVQGDYVLNVKGKKFENLNEDVNEVYVGKKITKHVGVVASATLDASVSFSGGVSASFSDISFSRTAFSVSKKDALVERSFTDIKNAMVKVFGQEFMVVK